MGRRPLPVIIMLMLAACLSQGCARILLYFGKAEPGVQAPWAPKPKSVPGRHRVSVVSTRRILPGKGIPPSAIVKTSNNNVAVIRYEGRTWLAWRTAPSHFASPGVILQVMSSADERTWRLECRIAMDSDLREPEWLALKGKLFLYFTQLGSNSLAFEPKGMFAAVRDEHGRWSGPHPMGLGDVIGWRIRHVDGRPVLIAYENGVSLFRIGGDPLRVDLLTTDDGLNWRPLDPGHKSVHVGGGSEADFDFAPDGTLYAVMRNEFGERGRYGSLVCTAPPGRMTEWTCRDDPRKFDSPYVFAHDGEVYLLARRNVTPSGAFELPVFMRNIRNHLSYIVKGKRCSLWRFADGGKRIVFVLDLPSRGDTCFPSVLEGKDGKVIVYDYSSDIRGPDSPWSVGQRRPTYLYRHELAFTR